jgi:protoheme IX farnesyltransferase
VVFGAVWSWHTISGVRARDDTVWAKQNFMLSVNYLMVVFLAMVVNTQGDGAWLP